MQRGLTVRTAIATYRLQMCCGFTLDDAAAIAEYLAQLGISHLYSSPVLQAGKGSTHGYDVLDYSRVSRELGGEAAFERLFMALLKHDLGLLLDIVPNHMAIGGIASSMFPEATRVARPLASAGNCGMFTSQPCGSSPAMRRRSSRASAGCCCS